MAFPLAMARFFSIPARRHYLAKRSSEVLRDFYLSPLSLDVDYRHCPMVALDLETSGLNPIEDSILSIGLINIDEGEIILDSAWHQLVRPGHALNAENVLIHQLTDDHLADAPTLMTILPELLQRLSGRVLIAHHAQMEIGFLDQACRQIYAQAFYQPCIDTEVLGRRQQRGAHDEMQANQLRLANLRQKYALPAIKSHHALNDALAAAELMLVQAAHIAGKRPLAVRHLLKSRLG